MSKLNFLIEKYLVVEANYVREIKEYEKVMTGEWTEIDDKIFDMEEVMKGIEKQIFEIKPEWKSILEYMPYEKAAEFLDNNREYTLETLQMAYSHIQSKKPLN